MRNPEDSDIYWLDKFPPFLQLDNTKTQSPVEYEREGGGIELFKEQFVPSSDSLPSAANDITCLKLSHLA